MRYMKNKLLTCKELAAILKVSDRTVARWCRQGKIHGARKFGRVWRMPDSEFYH